MMVLALGVSFGGFVALSRAMEKHQLDLHGKQAATPRQRQRWRWLGWVLLAVAFALSVADHGWGLGPLLWLGTMTVAGVALAFGLYPYRPRWMLPLAALLLVAGLALALI